MNVEHIYIYICIHKSYCLVQLIAVNVGGNVTNKIYCYYYY